MSAITGTVKNGQIILDKATDLPDGCRVLVEPLTDEATVGVREEDWEDTPEAIADWIRWYDSLEPLQMTPQEEADWQAARQAQKDWEKAHFDERAEQLRRMWE